MMWESPESSVGNSQRRIVQSRDVDIEIGAMPIRVRTSSPGFARLLEERYGGFVAPVGMLHPAVELDVDLAPPGGSITAEDDVTVLTDEISYVRAVRSQKAEGRSRKTGVGSRQEAAGATGHSYFAFGAPFAGELARIGENTQAPVAALYLLAQGPENRIEPVGETEAARALLRNILFFAEDAELVRQLFDAALEFVRRVPVRRLVFVPDARVWELIR